MKERPILFSAPMVRAILDGRKTQTRRVVRNPVYSDPIRHMEGGAFFKCANGDEHWVRCPYGTLGDRLWVREAWRVGKGYDDLAGSAFEAPSVWYEADGHNMRLDRSGRYRHARFMPRWASRITLEVTGVRVERLQDISQDDAVAEGCDDTRDMRPAAGRIFYADGPRAAYSVLWDKINGPGSWDANPFVWVIEFKRLAKELG